MLTVLCVSHKLSRRYEIFIKLINYWQSMAVCGDVGKRGTVEQGLNRRLHQLGHHLIPMFENILQPPFDNKLGDVAKRLKRQAIADLVLHERFADFRFGKAMKVVPFLVRAF